MKTIEDWKKEVIAYNTQLNEQLQQNEQAKLLYYGFDVIDGQIIKNPDILFIGINPGQGNGNRHFEVIIDSEQMSYVDVYNTDYKTQYIGGYTLAEFTIDIIRNLGIAESDIQDYMLEKCVKTNLYHIITNNTTDIKSCLDTIANYGDYYNKSNYFCVELIKLLQPKIVVFEGVGAYNPIIEDCCEAKHTWNKEGNLAYFTIDELNVHGIGYKRNNLRGMEIDAATVADKIKSFDVL
jgi:hypothetical protein